MFSQHGNGERSDILDETARAVGNWFYGTYGTMVSRLCRISVRLRGSEWEDFQFSFLSKGASRFNVHWYLPDGWIWVQHGVQERMWDSVESYSLSIPSSDVSVSFCHWWCPSKNITFLLVIYILHDLLLLSHIIPLLLSPSAH
ncbi:hypothetical protein MAP00_003192 [Monascus purpureus]|nr:hypothetical protein MAP00_003192 [Monascus purpureus]